MCINWDAISAIATVLAVVFGFCGIFVSQYMSNKARIKHDVWIQKLEVFKTLSRRHGDIMESTIKEMSPEANDDFYTSLNLVPIIFRDSPEVLEKMYTYDDWVESRVNRDKINDILLNHEEIKKEHNERFQQLLNAMYDATKYS